MQTITLVHSISASLFLLDYIIKTVLLLGNKTAGLERYKKVSKVPSMIISTAFLATGIYLIAQIGFGKIGGWFHLKLTLVVVGLVLGIIGFKRNSKWMAIVSMVMFLYVYGLSETKDISMGMAKEDFSTVVTDPMAANYDSVLHGRMIYMNECARCHGKDGDAGLYDAPKLSESTCENRGLIGTIKSGRGGMPGFKDRLTEQEIFTVAQYVKTLRQE